MEIGDWRIIPISNLQSPISSLIIDMDKLVEMILASTKYRYVSPDLVRRVGAAELAKGRKLKEAVKATKNKLHQVGGAYQAGAIDFDRALVEMAAVADDPEGLRQLCRNLMQRHASTQERLPILDEFYATIFAHLPPIQSLMDVACGLNPLAWPWLPLPRDIVYVAYDIYADSTAFLQQALGLMGVINGRCQTRDIIAHPPTEPVDLVLILKTLTCLELGEKTAVSTLLNGLNARYLLISYPIQTLGGRRKGLGASYEQQFQALAAERGWQQYQRFEFATELAFLVVNRGD